MAYSSHMKTNAIVQREFDAMDGPFSLKKVAVYCKLIFGLLPKFVAVKVGRRVGDFFFGKPQEPEKGCILAEGVSLGFPTLSDLESICANTGKKLESRKTSVEFAGLMLHLYADAKKENIKPHVGGSGGVEHILSVMDATYYSTNYMLRSFANERLFYGPMDLFTPQDVVENPEEESTALVPYKGMQAHPNTFVSGKISLYRKGRKPGVVEALICQPGKTLYEMAFRASAGTGHMKLPSTSPTYMVFHYSPHLVELKDKLKATYLAEAQEFGTIPVEPEAT